MSSAGESETSILVEASHVFLILSDAQSREGNSRKYIVISILMYFLVQLKCVM